MAIGSLGLAARIRPLSLRTLTLMALLGSAATLRADDRPYDRSDESRLPRFGGYIPGGAFHPDGGNPWGGYTPFGRDGGWAKLDYGRGTGDFWPSYRFGRNDPSYLWIYAHRPPVRGLGPWDRQGRADDE